MWDMVVWEMEIWMRNLGLIGCWGRCFSVVLLLVLCELCIVCCSYGKDNFFSVLKKKKKCKVGKD